MPRTFRRWAALVAAAGACVVGAWQIAGPIVSWAQKPPIIFRSEFNKHESDIAEHFTQFANKLDCNAYHNRLGEIATQETFLSQAQSTIEANRQAGVRLTLVEIDTYNKNALSLKRLDEARQRLTLPQGCQ